MFASNLSKTLGGAASLLIGLALLIPLFAPFQALAATSCANPANCCIYWLRVVRGIEIHGDAWRIAPTHPISRSTEGDVILFDYGGVGKDHGAEIISFEGLVKEGDFTHPAYIKVLEANYNRGKVGTRLVPWDDETIKGVYRPGSL